MCFVCKNDGHNGSPKTRQIGILKVWFGGGMWCQLHSDWQEMAWVLFAFHVFSLKDMGFKGAVPGGYVAHSEGQPAAKRCGTGDLPRRPKDDSSRRLERGHVGQELWWSTNQWEDKFSIENMVNSWWFRTCLCIVDLLIHLLNWLLQSGLKFSSFVVECFNGFVVAECSAKTGWFLHNFYNVMMSFHFLRDRLKANYVPPHSRPYFAFLHTASGVTRSASPAPITSHQEAVREALLHPAIGVLWYGKFGHMVAMRHKPCISWHAVCLKHTERHHRAQIFINGNHDPRTLARPSALGERP